MTHKEKMHIIAAVSFVVGKIGYYTDHDEVIPLNYAKEWIKDLNVALDILVKNDD